MAIPTPSERIRFGVFEADLRSGELRKQGIKIKLHHQPFQVLTMLLEHPGEVVTREELKSKLWPLDTFVDFDVGLNSAIKKLRDALGDSAEIPRYVETLPRRGYRFISSLSDASPTKAEPRSAVAESVIEEQSSAASEGVVTGVSTVSGARSRWVLWAMAGVAGALLVLLAGLNAGGWRLRFWATAAPVHIRAIAVLPLENLSGDPAQEYFTDGMTDAVTTDLGRIGGLSELRVISRTSTMQYKGLNLKKTVQEIARELNVDAVVEGTVLRSGNRVRITANLIQAVPEKHLWAGSFERDLRDVLALQDDVSRAIAAQIRAKLTQPQMPSAPARGVNPEVYEYYLKGRYNLRERPGKQGYESAIRYFEMAIQEDPNYAPAYAGLAHCYGLGSFMGQEIPPREAWSKAAAAATKALELDDRLPEAHFGMATVRFRFDWNWAEAEREFKRGLELSPNDAFGHTNYASFLAVMGRPDEAMAEVTRARELDPLSPDVANDMAWIYQLFRRPDEAIAESRRALQLDPNFGRAHGQLARDYEAKGMYAEAVNEQLKADALSGRSSPEQIESLRKAFAASGIRGYWEKRLEWEKRQLNQPRYFDIARLCLSLGRRDEAFSWLEKAYEARYQNMPNIKIAAQWLDPVRSDPRYADLMRRVGLPQ